MTPLWLAAAGGVVGALAGPALVRIATSTLIRPRQVSAGARIGVSVVSAVLFGLVALTFGLTWELPAFIFFAGTSVILGAVDLIERRLPNAVLYPSLAVLPVLLALPAVATGAWASLVASGVGGVALFAIYFVLAVISPGGIGMGDVKLAALIGMALGFLGWTPMLIGGTAGFVVGGLTSLVALLSGRAGLKTALPYGPAMLAGAFVGILLS